MKHVKTLNTAMLKNTVAKGGCGECQTSCRLRAKQAAQLQINLAKTDNSYRV